MPHLKALMFTTAIVLAALALSPLVMGFTANKGMIR